MSRILSQLLIYLFAVCFAGQSYSQSKLNIVTSASMFHDMTQQIAGDLVTLSSIVPIGSDPHLYEPVPKDATAIMEADLIFVNGLTFEGWINELIQNAGSKARVIRITEGIDPISSIKYQNASDPHAWMSATNGLIYIENIKNALISADPPNAAVYSTNAAEYAKRLRHLDSYIRTAIESIPRDHRVLITSHDAFQYYGREYGLKLEAIMGISTESDAQTADLVRVTEAIKKYKVPAIFVESTINPAMIQQIAKDQAINIGGKLYADSLGEPNGEAGTYYDMLKYNTDVIVAALKQSTPTGTTQAPEDKPTSILTYALVVAILLIGFLFVVYKMSN